MKLFQKLIAAPAILSMATGFAVNASEINPSDLSKFSNSSNLVSLGDFKSDTLFPGDWAYDSLKDLTNSSKFNGNSVTRLEAAAELNNLIAGGEGLMNGTAIDRLSDELGSELAIMKGRVDGLEARVNTIEAGSFSDTTTASFKAAFVFGSEDSDDGSATANDTDDAIQAGYSFGMKLTTSFTGEDKLVTKFDAGNSKAGSLSEFGLNNTTADALIVDGISYTFPIGDMTAFVGDTVDGGSLFTIACAYGGPSDTLDDCGNPNANIGKGQKTNAGLSYDFDNGFTTAVGYSGLASGVMTEESLDQYAINAAYTGEEYGISLTLATVESSATEEDTYTAFNGYYTPEGVPSISVGYEIGDIGGAADGVDENTSFFVGLTWDEVGPGSAGVALGHSSREGADEEYMYEAYYDYPVNDGMTITPLVYVKENATAGSDDTTGVMVKTSFSF